MGIRQEVVADRYWLGVDGEGFGRNPHVYYLMVCGDRYIENVRGIGTAEALDFLLAAPTNARLCGYYLGYDWTMILRDMPNENIYRLLRPELRKLPAEEGRGFSSVWFGDVALHYLNGMMRIKTRKRQVTVWDLGRFYQCSFVEALRKWETIPTDEIDAIASMKDQRATFTAEDAERIRRYSFSEVSALAKLAAQLERAHCDIGLRPATWYGPGSTATRALNTLNIHTKRGDIPTAVQDCADRAFFGGRFEQSRLGRVENVTGYDIVSAYPAQVLKLPCLEHSTWEHVHYPPRQGLVRWTIGDIGEQPWGPLPCRLENGTIVYPRGGASGWAWANEYWAAREWSGVFGSEGWNLITTCECRPFARVSEWFAERLRVGKSGRGIVLKLALNSLYGKLAQSVGSPKFASRVWAGMVTAGCRAELLRMMRKHGNLGSIAAVATDGLYSTETIHCPPGGLGSWESEKHGSMWFVRPGVYWAESDDTIRARGLGRKTLLLQREAVKAAIEEKQARAYCGASTLFGAARMCVYQTPSQGVKRSTLYGEWHDVPARISLDPGPKRAPDWTLHRLSGVESAPYRGTALSDDAKLLRALADIYWGQQ